MLIICVFYISICLKVFIEIAIYISDLIKIYLNKKSFIKKNLLFFYRGVEMSI